MMPPRSGLAERIPYSLSRWTDVPAAKWAWMKEQIAQGQMIAIDPRNAVPYRWSLRPEDTLGLVFWTKDPTPLVMDAPWLLDYRFKIHVTVTGWEEVEKGAPSLALGAMKLAQAVGVFGPERVVWRFSPVPVVTDAVERFARIARLVGPAGVRQVFLSFLQPNDLMPETRGEAERLALLDWIGEVGDKYGIAVKLCNEDRLLAKKPKLYSTATSGICAPPEDFDLPGLEKSPSEGCGCALSADPFTINESCTFGCQYCYAADKALLPKKMNTTPHRKLQVLP